MTAARRGRSPSTISRELRRNAATRNGKLECRASTAQSKADLARGIQNRPISLNTTGFGSICTQAVRSDPGRRRECGETFRVEERPQQTAASGPPAADRVDPTADLQPAAIEFSVDESMRISHEAFYQSLHVEGRGALQRELTA